MEAHGLPTPRSYAGRRFIVTAQCRACNHAVVLDLAGLAAGRHADVSLLELPLRCRCGERGHSIRVDMERAPYGT